MSKIKKAKVEHLPSIQAKETSKESLKEDILLESRSSESEHDSNIEDSESSYVMPSSLLEDADLEFDSGSDSEDELDRLKNLQELHKDLI